MPSQDFIVPFCDQPVDVLYADNTLVLVNKPSGLLSVPGRHPDNHDCVVSRVQADFPEARIVHRLDMDTSGVMVLALDKDTHRQLSRQFELRQTSKRYIAEVDGIVTDDNGRIDLPIITDWPNRPLQKVDFEHGKAALTLYQVLSRDQQNHCSRLALTPITGRSHQLRIHLAELGHPILGCSFYAPPAVQQAANRLQLHACELRFTHPNSGEAMTGFAPCPF